MSFSFYIILVSTYSIKYIFKYFFLIIIIDFLKKKYYVGTTFYVKKLNSDNNTLNYCHHTIYFNPLRPLHKTLLAKIPSNQKIKFL